MHSQRTIDISDLSVGQQVRIIDTTNDIDEWLIINSVEMRYPYSKDIIKVGRTHTMDAVPMTLGQEFSAFSAFIGEAIVNIKFSLQKFLKIPLGATAVGTGINAHKDYQNNIFMFHGNSSLSYYCFEATYRYYKNRL